MRKNIFIILICFAYLSTYAQKETSNWTFGANCGLTWNTTRSLACTGLAGTPNATLSGLPNNITSSLNNLEGCATLSNSDGVLTFYTDGMRLFYKGVAIATDLLGHISSAQSGVFCPYPGSPEKCFVIAVGAMRANNLSYTVAYEDQYGGWIESGKKNILFQGAKGLTGENIAVVHHQNGQDYWVIAVGQGGYEISPSYFNAWLVTKNGVSTTPVSTSFNLAYRDQFGSSGYLKISPNGRRFILATYPDNRFWYGDFNSATGAFSNIKSIADFNGTDLARPYGVEFSSDQSVVYFTDENGLYAFKADELFASNNISTVTKKKYSFTSTFGNSGAIQLGPDKRIYWSKTGTKYMYIIDNANDYNNIKIYQTPNNFLLGNCTTGLPTFSASWFSTPRGVMPVIPTLRTKSY